MPERTAGLARTLFQLPALTRWAFPAQAAQARHGGVPIGGFNIGGPDRPPQGGRLAGRSRLEQIVHDALRNRFADLAIVDELAKLAPVTLA